MNNEKNVMGKSKKCWTKRNFIEAWVNNTLGNKSVEGNYHVNFNSDGSSSLEYTATGSNGGTETVAIKLLSGIKNAIKMARETVTV